MANIRLVGTDKSLELAQNQSLIIIIFAFCDLAATRVAQSSIYRGKKQETYLNILEGSIAKNTQYVILIFVIGCLFSKNFHLIPLIATSVSMASLTKRKIRALNNKRILVWLLYDSIGPSYFVFTSIMMWISPSYIWLASYTFSTLLLLATILGEPGFYRKIYHRTVWRSLDRVWRKNSVIMEAIALTVILNLVPFIPTSNSKSETTVYLMSRLISVARIISSALVNSIFMKKNNLYQLEFIMGAFVIVLSVLLVAYSCNIGIVCSSELDIGYANIAFLLSIIVSSYVIITHSWYLLFNGDEYARVVISVMNMIVLVFFIYFDMELYSFVVCFIVSSVAFAVAVFYQYWVRRDTQGYRGL